jgi:hypothetical protein
MDKNGMKNIIYGALVPVFALIVPIIETLNASAIPLSGPGGRYVLIWTCASALGFGAVIAGSSVLGFVSVTLRNFAQSFLLIAIVLIATDITVGGRALINSLYSLTGAESTTIKIALYCTIIVPFATFGFFVFWKMQRNAVVLLFVMYGTMFAYTIGSTAAAQFGALSLNNREIKTLSGKPELPPIVHIVFDEMIGAEGIDRSLNGGEDMYRTILEFQRRFAFRTYGKAYSRHFLSAVSIPNLLNFDYADDTYGIVSKYVIRGNSVIGPIRMFDDKHDDGYQIVVFQPKHFNYCEATEVLDCQTFESFDRENQYIGASDNVLAGPQTFNIVLNALHESFVGSHLATSIKEAPTSTGVTVDRYDLHGFVGWFDAFTDSVLASGAGTMHFAHFLSPHAPYVLNKECQVQDRWINPYYLKESQNLSGEDLEEARSTNYSMYFDQLTCVYSKLTEFMTRLEASARHKNTIVVFHGDHGSRISSGRYWESLSERDMVDNYSTAFSIRSANIQPGYELRHVSVHRLFAEIFSADKSFAQPGDMAGTVAVERKAEGQMEIAKMPDFGISRAP